jgi:hypothetical protein
LLTVRDKDLVLKDYQQSKVKVGVKVRIWMKMKKLMMMMMMMMMIMTKIYYYCCHYYYYYNNRLQLKW